MTLTELAAYLHALDKPTRKDSDAVLYACGWAFGGGGWTLDERFHHHKKKPWWCRPDGASVQPRNRPDPARNLQDAVDLVEAEGMDWGREPSTSSGASMWVFSVDSPDNRRAFFGHGYKPAQALCIALMEAKAAQEAGE